MLAVCPPYGVYLHLNSLSWIPVAHGYLYEGFPGSPSNQLEVEFLPVVLITSFSRSLGCLSLIMPSCFYRGGLLIAGCLSSILNDLLLPCWQSSWLLLESVEVRAFPSHIKPWLIACKTTVFFVELAAARQVLM